MAKIHYVNYKLLKIAKPNLKILRPTPVG